MSLSLSLSLYIYIYIYAFSLSIYIYIYVLSIIVIGIYIYIYTSLGWPMGELGLACVGDGAPVPRAYKLRVFKVWLCESLKA